jgi:hypothetical protein
MMSRRIRSTPRAEKERCAVQQHLALEEQPTSEATGTTPESTYIERRGRFGALRDAYNARRYRAANLTVSLFVGIVLCGLVAWLSVTPWLFLGCAGCAVGFVAAFVRQAQLDNIYNRYATLAALNDEGLKRLARDWAAIPLREPPGATGQEDFAGDLDLLGHASLLHLVGTAVTPGGQERLRGWLLEPAPPEVVRERQAAVAELAPLVDLRDELAVRGRQVNMTAAAYERFLAWAEGDPWLRPRGGLVWVSRIVPAVVLVLLVAQLAGLLPFPYWLLFVGVNVLITQMWGKPVEALLDQVSERQRVFQPYADLFALLTSQTFAAPLLRRIQADLASNDVSAEHEMRRLGRMLQWGDLRLSMFFPVIQAVLLWTFHVLWFLEGWQATAGRSVRGWMGTLSELEALAALATLAYDNPEWAFPEIVTHEEPALLEASELGHPLLPPEDCVGNDVTVGPPGRFLLVTGSNMSGKSTLLRAIGVNVVLAQAGGPVCAAAMRLPPVALATSVRVRDSLEYGVSYFMAELRRLKWVVEVTETTLAQGERIPLFLLDEILHGTNTSERQIAARRVIRHLLALGAMGVVSTHDLTLADEPELRACSTTVHFTEQFTRGANGPVMRFDYKLRPGVATSTNALKLMEIVGLPLADDSPGEPQQSGR